MLLCAAAILAACKNEPEPTFSVGADDNAIVLAAGISDGGGGVVTRAGSEGAHVPFSNTTQMRLYVEGTWTGKAPETITKYTNCTTSAANSKYEGETEGANDIHPLGSFTPQLYWDDYGTADPDNATNRANGLKVFGVAVDGLSTLPDDLNAITSTSWTNLSWSVNTDGSNVLQKDLVVSNNHGDNSAPTTSGIKFTERTVPSKNILEYKHMMSKVTFVLIASNGFTDNKFTNTPDVVLTRNEYNQTTKDEYCYTSGTVNVKTATAAGSTLGTVTLQHKETTDAGVVTKYALIYPGSNFGDTDADIIARINADGNIYYVTAEKIRAALTAKYGGDDVNRFKTQSGINYVINVTVNKTGIVVTATIRNWETVEAAEVAPVIDINTSYGGTGTFDKDNFSFYRSLLLDKDYSKDFSGNQNNYFAAEAIVSKPTSPATKWIFSTPLYWPNHNTHYHMRGVWPQTVTTSGEDVTSPRVETSGQYQVIKVKNVAYEAGSFPSDLAIGRPDVDENAECTNQEPGHTKTNLYTGGICATEGTINLAFNYMMSQVEVHLSTTDPSATDHVELANAVVEVTNLHTTGDIKLGDRGCIPTGETSDYTLNVVSGAGNENKRHDAIVPQTLTYSTAGAETNVRFKITITNTDGTVDIYFADVEPICKSGTTEKIAPNGKWESGMHYVYNLKIAKSKIDVTATFKDWITVTASEPVWF